MDPEPNQGNTDMKVYQIVLNNDDVNEINSGGEYPAKYTAYLDASMKGDIVSFGHYEHVANVDTTDLDDAFKVMNRWAPEDEDRVERLAPLHSLSVGDILETNDGHRHLVAGCGFTQITL